MIDLPEDALLTVMLAHRLYQGGEPQARPAHGCAGRNLLGPMGSNAVRVTAEDRARGTYADRFNFEISVSTAEIFMVRSALMIPRSEHVEVILGRLKSFPAVAILRAAPDRQNHVGAASGPTGRGACALAGP